MTARLYDFQRLARARDRAVEHSKKAVQQKKMKISKKWKPDTPDAFMRWSKHKRTRQNTPAEIDGSLRARETLLKRIAAECTPEGHTKLREVGALYCNICHRKISPSCNHDHPPTH